MPEVLSNRPSLQEILWNFSRFKDEKQRLTLGDNPHFYSELPTSLEAYTDGLEIDPTDDFRHADEFYVLTDKPEPLYIVTDWGAQSFGNFWRPQIAIIFKGFGVSFFYFLPVSDVLPDIHGRLRGESIVRASLRGTYYGFCKRLPVSAVPRTSRNRRLQPIITQGHPWMSWELLIDYLAMNSSFDFGLCVCSGQAMPLSLIRSRVRCDVIQSLQ